MAYVIEIPHDSDSCNCVKEEYDDAKRYMVGLIDSLGKGYAYISGSRNNLAVDMCIGCYCLGIDPLYLWDKLSDLGLVLSGYRSDFKCRSETIMPYCEFWENSCSDIWNKAINRYEWEYYYHNTDEHMIEFKEVKA